MKLYKIKKSDIDKKGRGLYATKDIKEGTKIIDYVGKLITKKQTEEWINTTTVNQFIFLQLITVMTLMETFLGIQQD